MIWPSDFINKIICGDCLEVMKEMPGECIDLAITSPPYPGNKKDWGEFYNRENVDNAHKYLGKIWKECIRILKPGTKLIIIIANCNRRPYIPNTYFLYREILNHAEPLGEIIWNKGPNTGGFQLGSFCNPSEPSLIDNHEYILIFRKFGIRNKKKGKFIETKNFMNWINTVWRISPERPSKVGHPAAFPIKIISQLIQLYSYENETIFDPLLGSGTTARAAKDLKRNFIGIEINPDYCKIAEERLAQGVL